MNTLLENSAILAALEHIRNHPNYEVVTVSPIQQIETETFPFETVSYGQRISITENEDPANPVVVQFSAMQKMTVTYFGALRRLVKATIIGGCDGVRYIYGSAKDQDNKVIAQKQGVGLISCEFVGDVAITQCVNL